MFVLYWCPKWVFDTIWYWWENVCEDGEWVNKSEWVGECVSTLETQKYTSHALSPSDGTGEYDSRPSREFTNEILPSHKMIHAQMHRAEMLHDNRRDSRRL